MLALTMHTKRVMRGPSHLQVAHVVLQATERATCSCSSACGRHLGWCSAHGSGFLLAPLLALPHGPSSQAPKLRSTSTTRPHSPQHLDLVFEGVRCVLRRLRDGATAALRD